MTKIYASKLERVGHFLVDLWFKFLWYWLNGMLFVAVIGSTIMVFIMFYVFVIHGIPSIFGGNGG